VVSAISVASRTAPGRGRGRRRDAGYDGPNGHDTVVAAPARFTELVAGHGVAFAALDDGPLRLMDTGATVGDVAVGGARAKLALARELPAMFTQVLQDSWAAATGAGAEADVVVHNGQVIAGQHIAEKLGVPAVLALPLPMYVPTQSFRGPDRSCRH
jgi:sterol 3beta-glucosyltransferase